MNYEGPVYRPPSEAFSLILQVTTGCSHNGCTFCGMYKGKNFRVKSWSEIENDIIYARNNLPEVKKIFLADGNALSLDTDNILRILQKLYDTFPELERVGTYAGPKDLLAKSMTELSEINAAGLAILYMGVESGNDSVLHSINKGVDAAKMIAAGKKAMDTGYQLSLTVITGLAGQEQSQIHAIDTARVVSEINPTYLGALTLMLLKNTPLYKQFETGAFKPLTPQQTLLELKYLLQNLHLTKCIFRCNHASNYLPLKGTLNEDKDRLLLMLDKAISNPEVLRPEFTRGL